jgi:hypothetical protein
MNEESVSDYSSEGQGSADPSPNGSDFVSTREWYDEMTLLHAVGDDLVVSGVVYDRTLWKIDSDGELLERSPDEVDRLRRDEWELAAEIDESPDLDPF